MIEIYPMITSIIAVGFNLFVMFLLSSKKNLSLRKIKIISVHFITLMLIIFLWKKIALNHDGVVYQRLSVIGGFIMGLIIIPFMGFDCKTDIFFLIGNVGNYMGILINFIDVAYGFPYFICFLINFSYLFLSCTNLNLKEKKDECKTD